MEDNKVILSGNQIELTNKIKSAVHEKVERLLRHEEQIIRINVELSYDQHKTNSGEYVAKGHIEINGAPMIVTEATDDIFKSIDNMVDKLDRKIRRRSRMNKVKRKNVHDVDIPAELPKVIGN